MRKTQEAQGIRDKKKQASNGQIQGKRKTK
jgi:hypothetical protein